MTMVARNTSRRSFAKLNDAGELETNYERWRCISAEDAKWRSRYEILAAYARPFDSVLELGCGSQHLRHLLHPTCNYVPSDVIQRSDDCLVIDLNSGSLPKFEVTFDLCIAAGVFEYVADVGAAIAWSCTLATALVFSYATTDDYPDINQRHFEYGWFSHLQDGALIEMCKDYGIACTSVSRWHRQNVYFARKAGMNAIRSEVVK
jgi:hypothetical protein